MEVISNYIQELMSNGLIETSNKRMLLLFVIVLCSVDVLTGLINAGLNKSIESDKFKRGAIGKTYELLIIGLSVMLDKLFKTDNYLFISTCIFYIILEVISILENTNEYVSYPQVIKDLINKFKVKGDNNNGK